MEQHGVETVSQAPDRGFADHRGRRDGARAALQRKRIVARAFAGADPARTDQQAGEAGDDFVDPAAADRDGFDDRNAEFGLELGAIELKPVAAGEIDHVKRDDRRQPEIDQLEREAEMVVEVGGVQDDQQGVGQPLAFLLTQQHIAGDGFVGAGRVETIGAGKIDQLQRPPIGKCQPSSVPLDRDSGIIADLLAGAGQRVEQGALAGIGIADDRNQPDRSHAAIRVTRMARA